MSKFKAMEKLVNTFYPDEYRFMTVEELESYSKKGVVYTSALVDIKAFPVEESKEESKEETKEESEPVNPFIMAHQKQLENLHSD